MTILQAGGVPAEADGQALAERIRRDQLAAVRRGLIGTLPVNILLSLTALVVAVEAGQGAPGALWFAASLAANALRLLLCRSASASLASAVPARVEGTLSLSRWAALLSGLVWASLPVLCEAYTGPQTVFYLTLTCGITAGAVTHGTAYARIPQAFITPPLLSICGCLLWAGEFDRVCLGLTVFLYLVVLTRAVFQSEGAFREASRLKNEATALAESREAALAAARTLADEMAHRAAHDGLTGLLNRAGFLDGAEGRPEADCLMLLDLDGFKAVNDGYGHETGDRVLVEVARRLRRVGPAGCLAARLSGDEFALLYDPERSGLAPGALAAGLIAAVAEPFEGFEAGRLGVSIGVHRGRTESLTERLSRADEALYAAKAAGRSRYRLFDSGLSGRSDLRRDGGRDLPQALAAGALEVWFQPIHSAGDGGLVGLEALVRWRHPRHGWVPPGDLIAAAAMAGLAEPLLRTILERVCAMMAALRARGRGDVRVAMNVSPREMVQVPVDEIVLERLAAHGLPATGFEIEITEETALDIAAVQDKLAALSRAGVRVALDDFGAGYSSLSYLRQLRADRIKIDRGLVTGLGGSDDKRSLVQAVLGLGRALGLEVVAEGVETAEDLATLTALGCPLVQGYHLGRPMPAAALLERLPAPVPRAA